MSLLVVFRAARLETSALCLLGLTATSGVVFGGCDRDSTQSRPTPGTRVPDDSGSCPPCGPHVVPPPGCGACPDNSGALARLDGETLELTTRLAAKVEGEESLRLLLGAGAVDCQAWAKAYPHVPQGLDPWLVLAAPEHLNPEGKSFQQLHVLDTSLADVGSRASGVESLKAAHNVTVTDASVTIRGKRTLELRGGFVANSCPDLEPAAPPRATATLEWRGRRVELTGALWLTETAEMLLSSTPIDCETAASSSADGAADWIARIQFDAEAHPRSARLMGLRAGPFFGKLERASGDSEQVVNEGAAPSSLEFDWTMQLDGGAGPMMLQGTAHPIACPRETAKQ